jgi:RHS repeat-associated protein
MFIIRDELLGRLRRKAIGDGLIRSFDGTDQTAVWEEKSSDLIVFDPKGNETRIGFDRLGFMNNVVSPLGQTLRFDRDRNGKLLKIAGPTGATVGLEYDSKGCVSGVSRDQRKLLDIAWGSRGELERVTYPDQTGAAFIYGPTGRLATVTDRRGVAQSFQYNASANLTAITDGNGNRTSFAYSGGSLPASKTYSDGVSEFFDYGFSGLLRQIAVGKSRKSNVAVAEFGYDDAGRIAAIRYGGDGGENLEFVYDDKGRVVEARTTGSIVKLRYNEHGRVVEEDQSGQVVTYEYNEDGSLAGLIGPAGDQVGFAYDADGRLATARDWNGGTYAFGYGKDGSSRRAFPNGLTTLITSTTNGLPESIRTLLPFGKSDAEQGGEAFGIRYKYDEEDRVQSLRDSEFGELTYSYDPESQLLGVQSDRPERCESFAYDGAGNCVQRNTAAVRVNSLNQIVAQGDTRCSYDARGNLASLSGVAGAWRFTFNARGVLIRADGSGGRTVEFGYDALGRRIWKQSAHARTRYIWAGSLLLRETTERLNAGTEPSPASIQDYLYYPGLSTPLATRIDGTVYCYHTDHLGTPRRLTDPKGRVVWSAQYSGFGQIVAGTQKVHNSLRFPGQQYDEETGLHYNFFRYYSPILGRYISRDPVTYLGGLNVYAYGGNDPVNRADILGLWPSWNTVAAVAVGVAIGVLIVATCGTAAPVLIAAAAIGGAVAGGLGEALNEKTLCPSCIAKAAIYGAFAGAVGAAAAIVAAPVLAAAGLGAAATAIGAGMIAGAASYSAGVGANPTAHWDWGDFAGATAFGGLLGGIGEAVTGGGESAPPDSTAPEPDAQPPASQDALDPANDPATDPTPEDAQATPDDRPPKTADDIDRGRQNIHNQGTNEYNTRSASQKGPPTAWADGVDGDATTVDAYNNGDVTKTHPDGSPSEVKWDAGKPVGENGETQVTVKTKQNGQMHGFPSGPKTDPGN